MHLLSEIKTTYRNSLKSHDIAWNTYVARPIAALLVVFLCRTKLTPNQVTILGALLFTTLVVPLNIGVYLSMTSVLSLLLGVLLVELAYIFDCADGQLARLKGMTSDIGSYFDFLVDEVKALLLVGAFSIRCWQETGGTYWLLVGIFGCAIVSIATSLTNFIRRKEYTGGEEIRPGASANVGKMPTGVVGRGIWLVKRILSFAVHYPSWIWILPLLQLLIGGVEVAGVELSASILFLAIFLGVYTLYLLKTGLSVVLKLGSPSFYKGR